MAQTDLCGTKLPEDSMFDVPFDQADQNVTMSILRTLTHMFLKFIFWDFAQDNGDNNEIVLEEERLNLVSEFDRQFNDYNIFFKYDGHSVIKSTF